MRSFISKNWYKLSMSVAMIIFAFGFLIFSLKYNTASAGSPKTYTGGDSDYWMVGAGNAIYKVAWDKYTSKYKSEKIGP